MIHGNIEGIKNSTLNVLEEIYNIKVPKDSICTEEIIEIIAKVSSNIEREVSVAIGRKGNIVSVAIGDSSSVDLPIIDIKENRLSGVRIIHTHPSGVSNLSALDISALLKLKLDAIVAIGLKDDGEITSASVGYCFVKNNILIEEEIENISIEKLLNINILDKVSYIEEAIRNNRVEEDNTERAIIVGCDTEESLNELAELADACEIPVEAKIFQSRNKIDSAFYVGRGKVQEIAALRQQLRVNVVIFDDELAPSQVRNLEQFIGTKVIDRTTLILEIFARRAKTREAKIQVELAQLKYRASRLQGLGTVLSRTGGGIGTRGPGEKKLETDRRHIKERIYYLNDELKKIRKNRETQREKRSKQSIPQVSLVGYTNAGKSTLRNLICELAPGKEGIVKEKVFEANMLFATLDTTSRAVTLRDNRNITLTDTVGFVKKLPHGLVEAFKSTLEEVIYSDLLLHVVDSSSSYAKDQIEAVNIVLSELGARDKNTIVVLNKIDMASEEQLEELRELCLGENIIEVSAIKRINIEELLEKIGDNIPVTLKQVEYLIPYTDGKTGPFLHRHANILEEEYKDNGTYIKAEVDDEVYNKCKNYEI